MIITINGKPGSGKTTVAKDIAWQLGYKHVSMGDIRGELAKKHNMTIDELNKVGETEKWTDEECDSYLRRLGNEEDNLCIDTWAGFHFIPHSVKVFIECSFDVGAERIFRNQRPDEKHHDNVEEVKEMIVNRWNQTRQRFIKWYGFDVEDMSQYDIIVDSTGISSRQAADEIMEFVKKSLNS